MEAGLANIASRHAKPGISKLHTKWVNTKGIHFTGITSRPSRHYVCAARYCRQESSPA